MAFGLRYYTELRSKHKGVFWRVEIGERDYTGKADEMHMEGMKPLSITWERRGDEFFVPVKGSEATINILCHKNFQYINLFTADPRRFRVSIYRNTKLYWRGFVVADFYSEKFTAPPYQVTIKAVDGFKLLSNVPFRMSDGQWFTGKYSAWSLLSRCFDLLELDIDVADWVDLYAEGMNQTRSPLTQAYIDMDRFMVVYEEPTYRDVLEVCLRPFGAQIFQSNGTLHIRRAVSLYQDTRPVSFYSIGAEFPSGWLTTADGKGIVTADGKAIITESTRDRIESIWEKDINISGESIMDIVPALQKVTVDVRNKAIADIIPLIGFYNLWNWSDPWDCISLKDANTLIVEGDSDHKDHIITFRGANFQQCTYIFNLDFSIRGYWRRWATTSSRGPEDHKNKFTYGFRLIGSGVTYWLQDDGQWTTREEWFVDEINCPDESSRRVEIQGMPVNGTFQFLIKMTLKGTVTANSRYGELETCYIQNMKMTVDTANAYEDSLVHDTMLNPANNAQMNIPLPIADIPILPNDTLIYTLYFLDNTWKPSRMWRTKGRNDYNTLIAHLVQCALKFKQLPSRRISGEMFTGSHVDMNSVYQDDKFLFAGFYVNSIDLNALNDIYNVELVEMPGLLNKPKPPTGDDFLKIAEFPATVKTIIKTGNQIIALLSDNKVYSYDAASGMLRMLYTSNSNANPRLFPSDNSFTILENTRNIKVFDFNGKVIKTYTATPMERFSVCFATYQDGYVIVGWFRASYYEPPRAGTTGSGYTYPDTIHFRRPEFVYQPSGSTYGSSSSSSRGGSILPYSPYIEGKYQSIVKGYSTVVYNSTEKGAIWDKRTTGQLDCEVLSNGWSVVTLSDYFIGFNTSTQFRIYRRDTINQRTLIKTITGKADFADHTLGEFAYTQNNVIRIWTRATNTTRTVRNPAGNGQNIIGLFYINGELYVIRGKSIFKYIE